MRTYTNATKEHLSKIESPMPRERLNSMGAWRSFSALHRRTLQNAASKSYCTIFPEMSALVVRAKAVSFESAFNPDRSFLYSDWQFKITEVFKNGEHRYYAPGNILTVTRSGGSLIWNGKKVVSYDSNFPAFVVGEDYVLYLVAVEGEPDTYQVTNESGGAFRIGKKVEYLLNPFEANMHSIAKQVPKMMSRLSWTTCGRVRSERSQGRSCWFH